MRCVVSMQNLHNYMNPIKHAFERTKKKTKLKMNIKISFFSCFRQKLIFLYIRKIPPAHTQTKIETKMGRRKKSKKSDMWGKIITREDKENLYNAGDFSITLQEGPQVERELVDKLVEQIKENNIPVYCMSLHRENAVRTSLVSSDTN